MQNEDTTKYIIRTKITADGVIERPDIVGAIFGQTEGLLGTDLDLRELQKTGRIGRIEVMVTTKNGKTRGNIFIPSSLDKVKTSVLAASLETIDRVGPCVANIEVMKIEDVRASKRVDIVERAKNIYKTMFEDDLIEAQEITDVIRESVRVEGITSYGKNKLPAGPEYNSNEIIVVEGRADVLNLLKGGIKNTISVGGTNIPPEVIDLLKGKKVTVFTDGDRGGELIIRELMQVSNVDYIARPPDGKAVEDMLQKEIVLALRRKMTKDQYIEKYGLVIPAKRTRKTVEPSKSARAVKTVEKAAPKRVAAIRKPASGRMIDEEEEVPVRRSRTERTVEKPERRKLSEKIAEPAEREEKPARQLRARSVKPKTEEIDDAIAVNYVDLDESAAEEEKPRRGRRPAVLAVAEEAVEYEYEPKKAQRGRDREESRDERPAPRDRNDRNQRDRSDRGRREEEPVKEKKPAIPAPFDKEMEKLVGTMSSKILDENNAVISEMPVRELAVALKKGVDGAKSILFDGVVSQRIVDLAADQGVENLIGLKTGNVVKMPADMKVFTAQ
ncbi:DNA primase [Methanimicrococcus stummii]|uniref:DNA primase DnaG n=1 Tax=Methanimicrococcus stummii TaxID=3028294 RepID=A0AA96ZXP4_9EURY|nr:DNA primase DnaG [Methanimicrococcus sp. Es2]WNY29209.1 DNA primase [Methanimicrococcus sp. Es2]